MAASTKPLAERRVLLVEDDYFIVSDMARSFEADGAEVVGPAASVADALALLAGTPHLDAAVLDINLRGEMVFPVAEALEARGVPFVFATGYDRVAVPPRYAAVAHYEKPVEPAAIARALLGT
ncbi:response regulator [uncultured Methylobacterium sp.]|uniref:response regulator n=1 Tax=uncultured Methylobacterium sp. TaxID=157278 RepID=UPI0035CB2734